MQRRDFLRLMGLTAAAAAVTGPAVVHAASESPILRTTYPMHGEPGSWMTVYCLSAPAAKRCRAELILPATASKNTMAYVTGVRTGNDPAQIVVDNVRVRSLNMLAAEIDSAVFNTDVLYCPVDWGAVKRGEPLTLDYQSWDADQDQVLLLGLFYEVRNLDTLQPIGHRYGPRLSDIHLPGGTRSLLR